MRKILLTVSAIAGSSAFIFPAFAQRGTPFISPHCKVTNNPNWSYCERPPLDVADRADPQELRQWGVPPAPDKAKYPDQYRLWRRIAFEMQRFVPEITETPGRKSSFIEDKLRQRAARQRAAAATASSGPKRDMMGWAGTVSESQGSATGLLQSVFSTWYSNVPSVPLSSDGKTCPGIQEYYVVAWVGIDGLANNGDHQTNTNVLQDGVADKVSCPGAGVVAQDQKNFWIEFYPSTYIETISSYQIPFGDQVYVSATQYPATQSTVGQGILYFADLTANLSSMATFNTSTTTSSNPFLPNEAEVIEEAPGNTGTGSQAEAGDNTAPPAGWWLAPDWGTIQFTNSMVRVQDTGDLYGINSTYHPVVGEPDNFGPAFLTLFHANAESSTVTTPSSTEIDVQYDPPN